MPLHGPGPFSRSGDGDGSPAKRRNETGDDRSPLGNEDAPGALGRAGHNYQSRANCYSDINVGSRNLYLDTAPRSTSPPSLVNLTFVCPGNTRMLACVNTRKDPTRGDGCPRLGGRGTGGRKGRARGRVWGKGRGRGKEEGLEKEEGKWESEGEGKRKGEREHNERRVKRDI